MPKDSQINIRFDESTSDELTATAAALGVSKSQLVRHLTKTFLRDVKTTGALKLSPEWTRMLGVADARSEWGDRKIEAKSVMLNEKTEEVSSKRVAAGMFEKAGTYAEKKQERKKR